MGNITKKFGGSGINNFAFKHGWVGTKEYRIWEGMKTRCRTPSATSYKYYGGRGITICDDWYKSFISFILHVGPIPTQNHTIDRINSNGNYEPSNVRWATRSEQQRNKRRRQRIIPEEKVLMILKRYREK